MQYRPRLRACSTLSPAILLLLGITWLSAGCGLFPTAPPQPPHVVLIVADDLGYGELGCYGQQRIRTPHLDTLARHGMRFTQHYAGARSGTPSQCVLLTGLHTGHAAIRGLPAAVDGAADRAPALPAPPALPALPAAAVTIAEVLGARGYRTAAFGTWRLGGPATTGHPNAQGFDEFFGCLDRRHAGEPYPDHLWRDATRVPLPGNQGGGQQQFALDVIAERAVAFLRRQDGARPFFLYLPLPIPRGAPQVPADSLAQYKGRWREFPLRDGQPTPRAAHAARVTRMDEHIGRLLAVLRERDLTDDTLVLFTSDSGPEVGGWVDTGFFRSARPWRDAKDSLLEGGLLVPLIARWPGRIASGTTSHHVCAAWDLLPTLSELADAKAPEDLDGKPLHWTLLGQPRHQRRHGYLYWEHHQQQALRLGNWKALRPDPTGRIGLYDLAADITEIQDLSTQQPMVIRQVELILSAARTPAPRLPLRP